VGLTVCSLVLRQIKLTIQATIKKIVSYSYFTQWLELSTLLAAPGSGPTPHRPRPHFVGPYIKGVFQSPQPQKPPGKRVGKALAEEGYDIGEPWLPQPFFFCFFPIYFKNNIYILVILIDFYFILFFIYFKKYIYILLLYLYIIILFILI